MKFSKISLYLACPTFRDEFIFQDEFSDNKSIPLIIFGAVTLLGGILSFILPETRGVKLPDTIEDAETFSTKALTYSADDSAAKQDDSNVAESTKL